MNEYCNDTAYAIWSERSVIADCLRVLGLTNMANSLHTANISQDIIEDYVKVAHKLAKNLNDIDVIQRLCFAGLIYG